MAIHIERRRFIAALARRRCGRWRKLTIVVTLGEELNLRGS
jgi:hypothetical protein